MQEMPPSLPPDRSRQELVETAWWLRLLLLVFAAAGVASLISSSMQLELFFRPEWTPEQGDANDARQAVVGYVTIGIYILSVIAFARWVLLANRHARSLGAEGLAQTPGKAVLFFFVPFANLVLPYRGMRQLWQASHHPTAWQESPVPTLLPVWWGFWLAANVFGRIAKILGDAVHDLPSGILSTQVSIFQDVLTIVLGVLAWRVVSSITAAQLRAGEVPGGAHLP